MSEPTLVPLPLTALPLPEPPASVTQTTAGVTTTIHADVMPGWMSNNLRNILALALCGVVCWLAFQGHEQAQASLVAAFTVLCGAIWGERAALKRSSTEG